MLMRERTNLQFMIRDPSLKACLTDTENFSMLCILPVTFEASKAAPDATAFV